MNGLPVIVFLNLGYCSVDAPEFLKACDDVRAGKDSKWTRRFLWSDDPKATPPGTSDKVFFVQPKHLPGGEPGTLYDSEKYEFWQYSERAQQYYWTKWGGVDLKGNRVRLPQYNWASDEFLEEIERIVRFWMNTGLDGMLIDAVNWYIDCTWEKNRKYMTDVIASYGDTYSQPEGAGAFIEDPVAWITEGGWNSVQDYALGTPWRKGTNVIVNAIESGDPSPIEEALRNYHDRVVAVDGVLWFRPPRFEERDKQRLSVATVASLGDIISQFQRDYFRGDPEILWLVETKRKHPALHNLSTRRQMPTNADDKFYAFLRTAADGSERILVVLNFQLQKQKVEVDLSGVATAGLVDLKSGESMSRQNPLDLELPAYGYRLFQVLPVDISK
jgi:glycosidase